MFIYVIFLYLLSPGDVFLLPEIGFFYIKKVFYWVQWFFFIQGDAGYEAVTIT